MTGAARVHDRALLDALEQIAAKPYDADVWRITRKGRDPLQGASAHGRWGASGEIEVLYTSEQRDGALAEIGFRLSLEPVWPSRIEHELHAIAVRAERVLQLPALAQLEPLGVDIVRYASFDYAATQAIAAAARFMEFDGMLVPSARYECANLVLFTDRAPMTAQLQAISSEKVNWAQWRSRTRRAPAS
jgi:hypothetical protein